MQRPIYNFASSTAMKNLKASMDNIDRLLKSLAPSVDLAASFVVRLPKVQLPVLPKVQLPVLPKVQLPVLPKVQLPDLLPATKSAPKIRTCERCEAKDAKIAEQEREIAELIEMIPVVEESSG